MYATAVEQPKAERVRALAAQLYAQHRPQLLRIARANSSGLVDPEEALQQALCAFLTHYEPDSKSPPLAWLTLTLKRECWARYRREHLELRAAQEAGPDSEHIAAFLSNVPSGGALPVDAIEQRERVFETRSKLARLKPAERRAISLKAAGFSYREIGKLTG